MFLAPYPILTFWIDAALVLYAALIGVAVAGYTPTLRNQIRLAESGDLSTPEFMRLNGRGQALGGILGMIVLLILVLMVFKPSLYAFCRRAAG